MRVQTTSRTRRGKSHGNLETAPVVTDVDARSRKVVVLEPGMIPETPSGRLRRAHTWSLVG